MRIGITGMGFVGRSVADDYRDHAELVTFDISQGETYPAEAMRDGDPRSSAGGAPPPPHGPHAPPATPPPPRRAPPLSTPVPRRKRPVKLCCTLSTTVFNSREVAALAQRPGAPVTRSWRLRVSSFK